MERCRCDLAECCSAIYPKGAVIVTVPLSDKVKLVSGNIETPLTLAMDEELCSVRKLINLLFQK